MTHLFKRRNLPTELILEKVKAIPFIPQAKMNPLLQKIAPQLGSEELVEGYIPFEVKFALHPVLPL